MRGDPDPLRRALRAAELAVTYQQRATELARVRKAAIEEAHREKNLSYTEIAAALGISKGRITQIRGAAPGRERAFFGVGPVHIGVPLRRLTDHRTRTYIDASDSAAQEQAESVLTGLSLAAARFTIESDREEAPAGDSIVICGPRSAPLGAKLLDADPRLGFIRENDRWAIVDRVAGARFWSPRMSEPAENVEYGYAARHRHDDHVIIHVAGITAVGSSGVLHYLGTNLRPLYDGVGDRSFSMVVRCAFANDTKITSSEVVAGPYPWD